MTDSRVPVTLLTGFLGAGKTTVLNALLEDASSGRIAVIVNEFGDVGLDHDLIESSSEEVVLMGSGCLCCTVRGDLSRTILSLCARRGRGELDFDRIVVETTGLAEPGPILATLTSDPFLLRTARMDGVVTVADAANGPATLDAQFEAVSQAAVADLIVISKTDLVAPEQVIMFEERLRGLNPSAKLVRAVRGTGLAELTWGLSGLRRDVAPAEVLNWVKTTPTPANPLKNLSGLAPFSPDLAPISPHDSRIGSASITLEEPIEDEVFDTWLDTLIGLKGNDIMRVKGIVFLKGIETPFVFHGVGHVFDAPVPVKDWPGGDRTSRIVVIGRDITRLELQRSFDMLRADQSARC
ncbi:MAG: CobW family GTP-binding protein [Brevirhabdus sp.]